MAPKRRIAIVVMSDEHSGVALSAAGHPWIRTPHLDAFAAGHTRFASAYTNSPICIPARASFATGRYAHDTRNWCNASPYTGAPRGWAHLLRDAGFDVTSVGKLHFRNETDDTGFTRQLLPMHVVGGVGDLLGAVREPLPFGTRRRRWPRRSGSARAPTPPMTVPSRPIPSAGSGSTRTRTTGFSSPRSWRRTFR
jgi:choline-sulfatase